MITFLLFGRFQTLGTLEDDIKKYNSLEKVNDKTS